MKDLTGKKIVHLIREGTMSEKKPTHERIKKNLSKVTENRNLLAKEIYKLWLAMTGLFVLMALYFFLK